RGTIRPGARERVERIGDEHDPRRQRDVLPRQSIRVAHPIHALVARASALADERMQVELGEDVVRDHGMPPDDLPLSLVERRLLAQDLLRDADLAHVVEERADLDRLELLAAEAEPLRE